MDDAGRDRSTTESIRVQGEPLGARLVWLMILRVVLITVLLGATFFFNYGLGGVEAFGASSPRFLFALVAATYFVTIGYGVWYRLGRGLRVLARVQLGLDLVLWTALAYATGGIGSGFTFLFDLWIIVAGVIFSSRIAPYSTAAASAALLVLVQLALSQGILAPLADQPVIALSSRDVAYALVINVSALFVVALLVSSLTQRIERTGRGLERERARSADLQALHADVIRSLTVGLVTTDLEQEIVAINPAGQELLGRSADELVGTRVSDHLPEVGVLLAGASVQRARGNGVALRADGTAIPVDYQVAALFDAVGGRHGSVVVFSDLSELRRLEAALERTRRLAALGELGAGLAHEIRNPLGAISGSFQMLAVSPRLDGEERTLVGIAERELKRIEGLVGDMLAYARPREPRLASCDLSRVVTEVAEAFAVALESEERELVIAVEPGIETACDQDQIRQVLWNLLRNAGQATRPGDQISVGAHRVGESIEVEVADTGRGIAPSDYPRIFEPFYTRRERGLGLGLALCRQIADAHGATITAAPRTGGGTVFVLSLPQRKEAALLT